MSKMPAEFVWYDAMTSDLNAATEFYTKVLGWSTADSGLTDRSYTIVSAGPTAVAGLMPIPEDLRASGMSPAWSSYIGVDDVDAYAAKIKAAGGAIHRDPEDIPGVGRFAVVADPQGAGFMLFKGNGETPAPIAPGTLGHVGWHELRAVDGAQAFAFYSELFGWTRGEALDMGDMGIYQVFHIGDVPIGGMMTKSPDTPTPYWLYYFNVDSVEAAVGRVTSAGGRLRFGPHQVPGGSWVAQVSDPQGAVFAVLSMQA